MKTILKFTVVIALMFVAFAGLANETTLIAESGKKSLVFELDTQAKETDIQFIDIGGNIIYSENVIEKISYTKRFNLKSLENGSYFLKVDNSLKDVIYTIAVTDADVKIIDRVEVLKPLFKEKDGLAYVYFLNLNKSEVQIIVFDSANRILFEETTEDQIVEKKISFKKALEDNYTVAVKYDGKTFYNGVAVN